VTKDEIIKIIKESPLSEQDFQEILSALIETVMANAFMGMGLDMLSGQSAAVGRWVHTPACKEDHEGERAGYTWRGPTTGPGHEHWAVE
jgi:hypothetical protein